MNQEALDTERVSDSADGPGPDMRRGPGPAIMSAQTLARNEVYNLEDEEVGDIEDIMLDVRSGTVCYAVLSFGGFLGMGGKLFAVPWRALELDSENKHFVLDVNKERLKDAPGFDKDHWPNMADQAWAKAIHTYYAANYQTGSARGR